jgi:hypothetical protein
MPTSIEIENDILFISVTGECPLNELQSTQLKASTISKEQGIHRILVDLRQACLDLKTIQLFEINKSHVDLFPLGTKHALIISQVTGNPGDEKFVENVAVNRGVLLKIFVDIENAMEWLEE